MYAHTNSQRMYGDRATSIGAGEAGATLPLLAVGELIVKETGILPLQLVRRHALVEGSEVQHPALDKPPLPLQHLRPQHKSVRARRRDAPTSRAVSHMLASHPSIHPSIDRQRTDRLATHAHAYIHTSRIRTYLHNIHDMHICM